MNTLNKNISINLILNNQSNLLSNYSNILSNYLNILSN